MDIGQAATTIGLVQTGSCCWVYFLLGSGGIYFVLAVGEVYGILLVPEYTVYCAGVVFFGTFLWAPKRHKRRFGFARSFSSTEFHSVHLLG